VRPDDAEVGHTYLLGDGFLYEGEHVELVHVSWVLFADLVKPKEIDQVYQFEMSGQ
jgi:hypothetical protein